MQADQHVLLCCVIKAHLKKHYKWLYDTEQNSVSECVCMCACVRVCVCVCETVCVYHVGDRLGQASLYCRVVLCRGA